MKRIGFAVVIVLLAATLSNAAIIEGRLVNGTSGNPATTGTVFLVDLREGMGPRTEAVVDNGAFRFEGLDPTGDRHYLIQSEFDGVVYTVSVLLNEADEIVPVELKIYEQTDSVEGVHVRSRHVIARRDHSLMRIHEIVEVANHSDPPKTYEVNGGSYLFHLPDGARLLGVSVNTGTLPLSREGSETDRSDYLRVDYPLKPGMTRYEYSYEVDYTEEAYSFAEQMEYDIEFFGLFVGPADIGVQVTPLEPMGHDPDSGLAVYGGNGLSRGDLLEIGFSGGSHEMPETSAASDPSGQHQDDTSAPGRVFSRENRLSKYAFLIIAGTLGVLLLGAILAPAMRSTPGP